MTFGAQHLYNLAILLLAIDYSNVLAFNREIEPYQDALPGGQLLKLTGLSVRRPLLHGWTNGSCQLEGKDDEIDISRIVRGNWFVVYQNSVGKNNVPFLEPFTVTFNRRECTFVHISYNPKSQDLKMQYRCRDNFTEDFQFKKCQYYVKFTSDRYIKYEVAEGCALKMQLRRVMITNTDYKNFIVIRGCTIKSDLNNSLLQREYLLVLVRHLLDEILKQKILFLIKSVYKKNDLVILDSKNFLKIFNSSRNHCNCPNYTCRKIDGLCLPMVFVKTKNLASKKIPVILAICLLWFILYLPIYCI